MFKHLYGLLLLSALLTTNAVAQERTVEKRTVRDTTGQVTAVEQVETVSTTEDITPREHMITVNPLKFFLFYNLSYYQKISDGVGLGGGLQMPTLHDVDGFGVNLEARFYPSGRTLRGFYVAPNFSYNFIGSGDEDANSASIGALLGWQWFPGDDFAMGLGIGLDYYFTSSSEEEFDDFDGMAPALRFDIGYAW